MNIFSVKKKFILISWAKFDEFISKKRKTNSPSFFKKKKKEIFSYKFQLCKFIFVALINRFIY